MGHRLAAAPVRRGYAGLHWPGRVRRPRRVAHRAADLLRRDRARRAPYVGVNFVGTLHAGPTLIEEGSDAQKAEHLPKILRGEEVWCQGFSEPGRRLRPRVAAHARRARRRRLRAQRPEDLVLVRPDRRRGRVPRAHRSRRAEASRHLVVDPADGLARHRGAAAQDGARELGVRRGVPHRRARAGRQPRRRRERRLAGHQRHAEVRARHRVRERARRLAAAVRRPRAARARSRPTPRARALHRRARRAVGAHEAQRLAVGAARWARARW